MRSSAVVSLLVATAVFAAPLSRRQDATASPTDVTATAGSPTDTSGESAVLDSSIPILQAIAETDPTDSTAVAALQQQLAALPADQQQAITTLVTNVSSISSQFANVSDDDMHLIENYITSNLSPIQEEFFINELTGQPAPNQPGGALPSALSSQFKKLPAAERKAYALMALAIGPTEKQMNYIQKKLGGASAASTTDPTATAASVSDDSSSDSGSSNSGSSSSSSSSKKKDDKKKSDKKKSDKKKDDKKSSSSSDSDNSDDSASAASTTDSSSSSSSSDATADASATPSSADIQAQLQCLSPSDAQTLLQQLQAQGASASDLQQIQAQIPSLTQQNWTAPSSCSAASKRSLADLD